MPDTGRTGLDSRHGSARRPRPPHPDALGRPTGTVGPPVSAPALLEACDLRIFLREQSGALARLIGRRPAVRPGADSGVDLTLREGEALALVGEPGSGRTALGRALLGLGHAAGGGVRYRGQELTGLTARELRSLRCRLQTVFQGPAPSLASGADLRTALLHRLRAHGLAGDRAAAEALAARAAQRAGLEPADRYLSADPTGLVPEAGYRAQLALALVTAPEVLLVGELPAVPERAPLARLLLDLRRELGLACVHITGDLAGAEAFCNTVAVVHLGRVVEVGPAAAVCRSPRHPYTRALLAAGGMPPPVSAEARRPVPPLGCAYHPRCPVALAGCGWEARDLLSLLERRWLDISPERAAAERRLLGGLDILREPRRGRAALAPGRGHRAAEVLEYLHGLRREASAVEPREPFWRGVAKLFEDSGRVVVEFSPAARLGLTPGTAPSEGGDGVRVACHLHPGTGTG